MGNTYFCFSDECGDYKPSMSDKQIKTHPYYIRTNLIINSSEWKFLNKEFRKLKDKYGIPVSKEVKWAHLWTLSHFQQKGQRIPTGYNVKWLEDYDCEDLISFAEEALNLINLLDEKKIIATYTINDSKRWLSEKRLLCFHLQEHMQRIEMELNVDEEDNLGTLYIDPVSPKKNEMFRDIYADFFTNGDFFNSYKNIKDSLNFEHSHQSCGIQIADYISGAFSALLKSSSSNNYIRGLGMYFNSVHPNLRKIAGRIQGFGIREVPKDDEQRSRMIKHIRNMRNVFENAS